MTEHAVITRLRQADPAAGLDVVIDPGLRRARVESIMASGSAEKSRDRRPRVRRAVAVAVVALAVPAAALAASAVFGPDDVERGLPAGARLLVGTEPACDEVQPDVVYDCKLRTPPSVEQPGLVQSGQPDWLGAVTLLVDRGDRINGGCRSQVSDGTAWRCYVGQAAADQQILDPNLLGTPIHDRCDGGAGSSGPPAASPYSAAPGSAIILCGSRDIVGFAAR
jgi:hypothetical protein